MILQNDRIIAEFSDNTGTMLRFCDRKKGLDWIEQVPEAPCRITAQYHVVWNGKETESRQMTFEGKQAELTASDEGLKISWKLEHGIVLNAAVKLLEDGLGFSSYATTNNDTKLLMVEYPVIGGLGEANGSTEMIHSFATGLRIKNPLQTLKNGEGVRYAPYPECFSGASMQFFAYLAPGKSGLLFTAEDSESHQKWLNLYRNEQAMEATMIYGYENIGYGKAFYAPYAFTIRLLNGDGWWEAAGRYKAWAVKQPWCSMGTLQQRRHCEWLLQDVGLTTFGIDASQDRSNYIRHYHNDANTKVFHVLGPDWANTIQSFCTTNPGYSLDGWVPVSFNEKNMEAIREVGDYFAPFEFDLFGSARIEEGKEIQEAAERNRQKFPKPTYSCDAYNFFMMCPCEDHTQQMHAERDRTVVEQSGADAMYYDISANNLLHICLDENHKHPVGGGNVITKAYRRLYADTKKACAQAKQHDYFPIGTEMMNEVFLPEIDYYQARAGAQPCSSLELWPYKKLIDAGQAELIPLFAYVYHEYGAVRMDGWGKCVEEVGDLFFDSVAKIYEWGGLYELNHEYSPGEAFDGVETKVEEHYWDGFGHFGYEYSYPRARYIRQFADMRTGRGNPYLAYGEMLPPPRCVIREASKHYFHYNHGKKEIYSGDISLPSIRAAAWKRTDNRIGYAIFLTNTELRPQAVTIHINRLEYPEAKTVKVVQGFGGMVSENILGTIPEQEDLVLTLELPFRSPVMLEIE